MSNIEMDFTRFADANGRKSADPTLVGWTLSELANSRNLRGGRPPSRW